MSTEDVVVSLSRLALAKAIKTPDDNEENSEPWTKSIIFYQSHIDDQMRESLTMSNKRRGRPMSTQLLMNNNRQRMSPVNQQRPDESKRHSNNPLQYKQPPPLQQRVSSSSGRSSLSSGKLVQTKPGRRYVPSDDEEEEEEDDDDDEDDDEDEDEGKSQSETFDHKTSVAKPITSKIITPPVSLDKKKNHLIAPSDDEKDPSSSSSSEQEEEESENEEESIPKGKQTEIVDEETYTRRMSTLRRLELGNSIHRRTRSTSDVMNLPTPSLTTPPAIKVTDPIDQWRMTVMEAEDISTPNSTNSSTSERPPSATNVNTPNRGRRSTISEMDMMFSQQQQQQQMYNMQLQQAMQYQQAQQMMQIQQYQQALQMQQQQQQMQQIQQHQMQHHQLQQHQIQQHHLQQQQMQHHQIQQMQQQPQQMYRSSMMLDPNRAAKQNNRRSVSGMDLMIQMEKEKASFRKANKKKLPDPSRAKLSTGLLSKVPEQGLHNINFQEYVLKQPKMAKSTITDQQLQQYNRRSQLSPMPMASVSTPIGYQPPNRPHYSKRNSTYSNLSQYI